MQILKHIADSDISNDFHTREAVRAVLFDENGNVPLLFSTKNIFHKIPGGGVEVGETFHQALEREILEEVGARITDVKELGIVEEYRSKFNLKQVSYCYVAHVVAKGENKLEPDEIEEGFEIIWVPLQKAIALLESDQPYDYEGPFIKKRELVFLREAAKYEQNLH